MLVVIWMVQVAASTALPWTQSPVAGLSARPMVFKVAILRMFSLLGAALAAVSTSFTRPPRPMVLLLLMPVDNSTLVHSPPKPQMRTVAETACTVCAAALVPLVPPWVNLLICHSGWVVAVLISAWHAMSSAINTVLVVMTAVMTSAFLLWLPV